MSSHRGRAGVRAIALVCALAVVLSVVSACTPSKGGSGDGADAAAGGSGAEAVPDTAKAVEKAITAAEGGVIGLKTADAVIRVTFPGDALAKDTVVVATPLTTAPGEDDQTVIKGFLLEEKGTGSGPKLNSPAWIEMVVAKKLTDADSLVAYAPDGTYEVLPTRTKSRDGASAVVAFTTHFSPVGGRNVGKDKAGKARDQFSDFNWVVYINNKQSATYGPLTQTVKLTLRAANSGGDIAGDYNGNATIVSSNTGNIGPMESTSPQTGKSDSVKITLTEGDPLAALTPDDPLAPLEPDPLAGVTLTPGQQMPQWWGTGSITMSAMAVKGTASGHIGGYGGTGNTKDTSTLPLQMFVEGTQVRLQVSGLAPGSMTFTGFVRGEGKK